jgi:hypothetical protein
MELGIWKRGFGIETFSSPKIIFFGYQIIVVL